MEVSRKRKPVESGLADILAAEQTIRRMSADDAAELEAQISTHPQDAWLKLWQGLHRLERNQPQQACEQFEKAVALGARHWRIQWYLAQAARQSGDLEKTDAACATLLKQNPEFWFARELPRHARGYYAQKEQDKVIELFFAEQPARKKVFVEVGAFDGTHYSNVRRLHEKHGWTGLSIEPVGKNFSKLARSYQNTSVRCVQAAVSDQEGEVELNVSVYPHLPDWGSDVATLVGGDTARWTKKYGAQWVKERVPAKRLTTILREQQMDDFDLLSVDAEGHDLEVLKSLDFARFRPQLIVVEYGQKREAIVTFLTQQGYSILLDNNQDIFAADITHGVAPADPEKPWPATRNYTGASGRAPYAEIQQDAEHRLHEFIQKPKTDIERVVIVGGFLGKEIDSFLANYPKAEIHVFEPSRRYFPELSRRFAKQARVICHNAAVGESDGTLTFHEGSLKGIGSLLPLKEREDELSWIPKKAKRAEEYPVRIVALDTFAPLRDQPIDLLWCDVQGAELKVLKGAERTLARCAALFLEVATVKTTYHGQCRLGELRDFLKARQFYLAAIGLCHSGNGTGNALWLRTGGHSSAPSDSTEVTTISEADRPALASKLNPNLLQHVSLDTATVLTEVDALSLFCPQRFDLTAKYLYGLYREMKVETDWPARLYNEHLRVFNKLDERDGSNKQGGPAFLTAFHETLDSIRDRGLDRAQSLVPVGHHRVIIDGAHRVAAGLVHGKKIPIVAFDWAARNYDFEYFRRKGLGLPWTDAMALEYVRLKPGVYVAAVFPSARGQDEEVRRLIRQCGPLCYARNVELNFQGACNLTRQIYAGETWLGDWRDGFAGARRKAERCFQHHGPLRLFVFQAERLADVRELKTAIRNLFNVENHSVHISDTPAQALEMARLLLNANSIHMLNHAQPRLFERFTPHLQEYKSWMSGQNVNPEHFCLDGSAVLSAYGLRDARDLDFLHYGHEGISTGHRKIGSHNSEVHHHVTSRDDIIFNPENHFFYEGVKFASLEIIRKMKTKRGEEKDRQDVALIESIGRNSAGRNVSLGRRVRRWCKVAATKAKRKLGSPYTFSNRWFCPHERHWFKHLIPWAEGRGPLNILEIGSYEGRSTCWFLDYLMEHPASRLTCADQWAQRSGTRTYSENMQTVFDTFSQNVQASGKAAQVQVRRGNSRDTLPKIEGELFDLIYVDGDHSADGVWFDTQQAHRLLKPGGMILWDDYYHADSVKEGVDRACRELGLTIFRLGKNACYQG